MIKTKKNKYFRKNIHNKNKNKKYKTRKIQRGGVPKRPLPSIPSISPRIAPPVPPPRIAQAGVAHPPAKPLPATPAVAEKPAAAVAPQVAEKPAAAVAPQVAEKPAAVAPQVAEKPAAVAPAVAEKPAAVAPAEEKPAAVASSRTGGLHAAQAARHAAAASPGESVSTSGSSTTDKKPNDDPDEQDEQDEQVRIMNQQEKVIEENKLKRKGSKFGSGMVSVVKDWFNGILARRMEKASQHNATEMAAKISDLTKGVAEKAVFQIINQIDEILLQNTQISKDTSIGDIEKRETFEKNMEDIKNLLSQIGSIVAKINIDHEAISGFNSNVLGLASEFGNNSGDAGHNKSKKLRQQQAGEPHASTPPAGEPHASTSPAPGGQPPHPPAGEPHASIPHPPAGEPHASTPHPPAGEPHASPPPAPGGQPPAPAGKGAFGKFKGLFSRKKALPGATQVATPQNGGAGNGNNKTRKNREYIHEVKENRKQLFDKEMEIINSIRNFTHGPHEHDHKHENINKKFIKVITRK